MYFQIFYNTFIHIHMHTWAGQYHQNTAKVLFIVQRLPLKWRICSGWCFQTYLNSRTTRFSHSDSSLCLHCSNEIYAVLTLGSFTAETHCFLFLIFIPFYSLFNHPEQNPFSEGSSIMCASLWFFLVVTSEAKHKACNFLPQASKTS